MQVGFKFSIEEHNIVGDHRATFLQQSAFFDLPEIRQVVLRKVVDEDEIERCRETVQDPLGSTPVHSDPIRKPGIGNDGFGSFSQGRIASTVWISARGPRTLASRRTE